MKQPCFLTKSYCSCYVRLLLTLYAAGNNKEAVMKHFTIVSMFHAASLQFVIMLVIIFPDKSVLFHTLE